MSDKERFQRQLMARKRTPECHHQGQQSQTKERSSTPDKVQHISASAVKWSEKPIVVKGKWGKLDANETVVCDFILPPTDILDSSHLTTAFINEKTLSSWGGVLQFPWLRTSAQGQVTASVKWVLLVWCCETRNFPTAQAECVSFCCAEFFSSCSCLSVLAIAPGWLLNRHDTEVEGAAACACSAACALHDMVCLIYTVYSRNTADMWLLRLKIESFAYPLLVWFI